MLVEAFFSTLVSFCLVQLLHNTEKTMRILTALYLEPYPSCRCRKRWFHFTFTL